MSDEIKIPAAYVGVDDATLAIEPDEYGDSYMMTLTASDGHVIASASGFRPGAMQDFGADAETAETFGAFLGAAVENRKYGDGEFAAEWEVLADDADEWADALIMMTETKEEN